MSAPQVSLYLYCDQNQVCDYFSRNLIAPASIIPLLPGAKPLSAICENALFVTHLTVSPENRGLGAGLEERTRIPITIELLSGEASSSVVFLVVKKSNGEINITRGTLAEYDKAKHIGAFLPGEIPLSCIKAVLFESEEHVNRIRRPSPDLWFPEKKFKILKKSFRGPSPLPDDFWNKTFDADFTGFCVAALKGVQKREKLRAAFLLFVVGTANWEIGDWVTGIDSPSQHFFGLDNATVSSLVPGWPLEANHSVSGLPWAPEPDNPDSGPERLYRAAFEHLVGIPYRLGGGNAKTTSEMIASLANVAEDEPRFKAELDLISSFLAHPTIGQTLPELLARLQNRPSICTALLMLSRIPNDIEELVRSLSIYKVGQEASRQAMVLWGALNGLHGVPGREYGKDVDALWSFIEYKADELDKETPRSFCPIPPKTLLKGKRLLDYLSIGKTEIIRKEAVLARFRELAVGWKKIPPSIAKAVRDGLVAESGRDALMPFETIAPGKLSSLLPKKPIGREEWERILGMLRAEGEKLFKLDDSAMCKAVLADESKFDALWQSSRTFWENEYKKAKTKQPKAKKTATEAPVSTSEPASSAETAGGKESSDD